MNVYVIGMAISFVIYLIIGYCVSKKVKDANDFYVACSIRSLPKVY